MKTLFLLLSACLIKPAFAQTIDTLSGRARKLLPDSASVFAPLTPSKYSFNTTSFNKSRSFVTPLPNGLKVELYSNPTYLQRNAFPVHPSAAETIFGTAAKITAQALQPNKKVF
ncbi:hypothetical protein [Segetibacter aerophilus]|uniref:hypothetical protein n=1 Tax=Segetibacter aerophilus TaxID=670293 RepID=UPI0011BE49CC|nr:hypothetical protein [Segetibacter aerophilus]